MGFGTLFFGYFLLLDLPYQTITNIAAAAVMLFAIYKLAYLNYSFTLSFYACSAFGIFALIEAGLDSLGLLGILNVSALPLWLGVLLHLLRNALIGTLSVLLLKGMSDVAYEVGLKRLAKKCSIWSKITIVLYAMNLCLGPQMLGTLSGTKAFYFLYVLYVITTILTLFLIAMNLTCIYGCYSGICMPEDNKESYSKKRSRFAFVNRFREHEDKKRMEYAEYRMEKQRKKQLKRNKNGKKR